MRRGRFNDCEAVCIGVCAGSSVNCQTIHTYGVTDSQSVENYQKYNRL